jgi:hypothetical protein
LAIFYGEWFSTLRLRVTNEAELTEAQEDLHAHGLLSRLTSTARSEDIRYEFIDRLMAGWCPPPTDEESVFITARYVA